MPFHSQAQRKYFFAAEARGELPEGTAKKWAKETPKLKELPEYAPEKDERKLRKLRRAKKKA